MLCGAQLLPILQLQPSIFDYLKKIVSNDKFNNWFNDIYQCFLCIFPLGSEIEGEIFYKKH